MKLSKMFLGCTLSLTMCGLFIGSAAHAADAQTTGGSKAALVGDVALHEGGVLKGQVLSVQGQPQASTKVVMLKAGKAVAYTSTDDAGKFAVRGVPAGVYRIQSQNNGGVYRAWAPGTAPPAAKPAVLLISDDTIVRGQVFGDEYGPAIRGVIAGGVITGGTYWALDANPAGS